MSLPAVAVGFCLFMAGCSCVYYLLVVVAAAHFRTTPQPQSGVTPPVSVFKPLHGLERELEELLAAFCRQDYPAYEILFAVADLADPAAGIVKRVQAAFPGVPARLVVADRHHGANRKVDSLDKMYREMRFEFLVISDADMRVGPDYLRRIMAPFADPNVGLVTCLYRAEPGGTAASLFEALGISGEFQPSALVARMLEGVTFAFGSTVAVRKELVEAIGGFPAIANASDDYEMGNRVARLGHKVILSPSIVTTVLPADNWRTMVQRQFRWARCTFASRPLGHAGLIFTYGLPFVLAALALAPHSALVWGMAGAWLALRVGSALIANALVFDDPVLRRYWPLVPARDLLTFGLWFASFFYTRAVWKGEEIRVEKGKMRPA